MADEGVAGLFQSVLMPAMEERTVSAAEIERRGGITADHVLDIVGAYGLPVPEPEAPAFSEQEAAVFVELGEFQDVWTPKLAIELGRVYGRLLARIAQTEVQLFRVYVAPQLARESDSPDEALVAVRDAFARLLPLSEPLLVGVHRRWLEHELAQQAVTAAETGGGDLPGAVQIAFLFCDLKDFTAYADSNGDTAAVMAIDRFTEIVTAERGDDFRFSKALGDGFMLAYSDPCQAVAAGERVIAETAKHRMPGVHASVHYGVSILREGDYFGNSVNLAARLLNAAGKDELIATRAVVDECGEQFDWRRIGERRIRGMNELTEVFRLDHS